MNIMKLARRESGFTLIELLIVVAIIAILAAIAVPNFLEAQVRAKVSAIKADQRTLRTALESYCIDNKCYPQSDILSRNRRKTAARKDCGWNALTTPVSFIQSIPLDKFGKKATQGKEVFSKPFIRLYSGAPGENVKSKARYFVMLSVGPGQNPEFIPSNHNKLLATEKVNSTLLLKCDPKNGPVGTHQGIPYDPTNGSVSNGGIFDVGGSKITFVVAKQNQPLN